MPGPPSRESPRIQFDFPSLSYQRRIFSAHQSNPKTSTAISSSTENDDEIMQAHIRFKICRFNLSQAHFAPFIRQRTQGQYGWFQYEFV